MGTPESSGEGAACTTAPLVRMPLNCRQSVGTINHPARDRLASFLQVFQYMSQNVIEYFHLVPEVVKKVK